MVNFKKILKKVIFYIGAFLAVMTLSAGIKVCLFLITRQPQNPDDTVPDVTINNNLTKILNNVLSTDNADFTFDAVVSPNEQSQPIKVTTTISLTMSGNTPNAQSPFDDLKLEMLGNVEFNSQLVPYKIQYLNGYVFADIGEFKVKLETNNVGSDINKILNFAMLKKFGVNIELPDLSQISLDPSILTTLAGQMTEEEIENGKKLTMNILSYGSAVITTDNDYSLKTIDLSNMDFNGTKLSASVKANLKAEPTTIAEPTNKEEITDFSSLTKFLESTDRLMDKGYISGKLNLNIMGENVSADYYFNFDDFNDLKVYIKTVVKGEDMILSYQNNKYLFSYGESKYYHSSEIDLDGLKQSLSFYASKFGITLPDIDIQEIMDSLNVQDLNSLLELVGGLKIDENGLDFTKQSFGVNIAIQNGEFAVLNAHYKDILSLSLTLNEEIERQEFNEEEFKNTLEENLFNLLNQQLIKNKNLAVKADIMIDDILIKANLKADFSQDILIQLSLEAFEKQVVLTIKNDIAYLDIAGVLKAKGSISQVIDYLKENNILQIDSTSLDFDTIKNILLGSLNSDDIKIKFVRQNNSIEYISISKDNVKANLVAVDFEEIEYNEADAYQNLIDIVKCSKNLIEVLTQNDLAFNVSANVGSYAINGKVQYANDTFTAVLNTQIFNKQAQIVFANNNLYIDFAGLKLGISTDDAKKLVQELKDEFNLDLTETMGLMALDIDQILANSSITFNGENITLLFNGISININTKSFQVSVNYESVSANVTLGEKFSANVSGDYTDIYSLKDLMKAVYNSYSQKTVSGKISVQLANENLRFDYILDFNDFENIKFGLKTNILNTDFAIYYQNNKIYLSLGQFKYIVENNFDFNEIIDAVKFYANRFNIDLSVIKFDEILELINTKNLAALIDYIGGITLSPTGICYADSNLSASITTKNDYLDKLTLNYKDKLSCSISLNEQVDIPSLTEEDYKSITDEKLFTQLYKQIIQDKTLALKFNVTVKDIAVESNLKADFTNGILAQLSLKAFDKTALITLDNDTIYMDIAGVVKAKASTQDLIDYLKQSGLLDSQNPKFDKDFVDGIINSEALKDIAIQVIKLNDSIDGINFTFKDVECNVTLSNFENIAFDKTGNYQNLIYVIDSIKNIYEKLYSNGLMFNINASYNDYKVGGSIQYKNNSLQAKLGTKLLEKDLIIELEENIVYINFDGLKLSCSLENLSNIIKELQTDYNLDLNDKLDLQNIDIDSILSQLNISFTEGQIEVTYQDILTIIDTDNFEVKFNKADISASVTLGSEFTLSSKENYIDIYSLKDVAKATYNTLKNLAISGKVEVTINLFDEDNLLNIDYAIGYQDEKLIGYIFTNFKGLDINAYLDGKDIYLDIASLKVHFNIIDIDEIIAWVNNIFGVEIKFDINELFNTDKLKEISFDIIKSVVVSDGKLNAEFNNDLQIVVDFDDYIRKVEFNQNNKKATLTCTDFDTIHLDRLNKSEYREYTIFTGLLESANNLVKSKQYSITAGIDKYNSGARQNHIDASLNLDITSLLGANLTITGLDEQIDVNYENKVLYFCYGGTNGLKIAIQENALQEILSIVCSALNIDVESIPLLKDFLQKTDIDTGNLSTIMPKIDLGNPLGYLEYIDGFSVTDNCFMITLKAEKLGSWANNKDVTIKLNYSGSKIAGLNVENLYTNPSSNEYINITVVLNDFDKISTVANKEKYIDLSNSKDLIRAFVNTSNMNDYYIAGKIKFTIDIGAQINAATIDVDAKVKKQVTKEVVFDEALKEYVETEKTSLYGMIKLSNYPIIGGINNENTNSSISVTRKRTITIYFKDGNIYLSTIDEKTTFSKQLERMTKITSSYMFSNLKYYMQYLLGFKDNIQAKINEAIDKSQSYQGETDYGNIIEQYSKSGNAHTIKINLAELAHNSDIGSLTVILTTLNDASTGGKDYLYRLDMDLKLLNDMFILQTDNKSSDNALYLKNIGSSVDMTEVENFITLYDDVYNFGLDGEYEKEGKNSWKQANTGSTTITFISQGEKLDEKTGNIASIVSMPNMSNIVVDDDITRVEYSFAGWFYDEAFTQEFTSNVFPRYNTTLFAKWVEVSNKTYATINFVTNEDLSVPSIKGFVGEELALPVCSNIEKQIDENNSVLKTFDGWYTADGKLFDSKVFTEKDITLYAHWTEVITKTYNLTIYNAGEVVYSGKVAKDTEFDVSVLSCYKSTTLFYTNADFSDDTILNNFVVSENSIWYARNKYTVTIISSYTVDGKPYKYECELYEKSSLSLTTFANGNVDNGSYLAEYTFNGYNLNGSEELITSSAVTTIAQDSVYEANWTKTEWCYVTFNVVWSRPSGWINDGTKKSMSNVSNTNAGTNKLKIKRNTDLVFSNYCATAMYKYKVTFFALNYDFKTVAWGSEAQNLNTNTYSGASSLTITNNCTLYPIWKADGAGHK